MQTEGQLHDILFNEEACNRYLLQAEVFYKTLKCDRCGEEMEQNLLRWTFRCTTGKCRREFSLRKHTFFFGSRLKSCQILRLAHLWLNKVTVSSAMAITGHSIHTVSDFYHHFRQLVSSSITLEDQIIGGDNIIVEIDETKMGKRKFNRGHRVDGVWIVAGVERTVHRHMFAVPVESRDKKTLTDIIVKYVAPGSIIHTDLWKGYSSLKENDDFIHRTVNHSKFYKDPETGIHTNFIEGTNSGLKRRIPVRSRVRKGIENHLLEYIWRRKNENGNLWDAFIQTIKDMHYDLE